MGEAPERVEAVGFHKKPFRLVSHPPAESGKIGQGGCEQATLPSETS